MVVIFVSLVTTWADRWTFRDHASWTLGELLFFVLPGVVLFLVAGLLFPPEPADLRSLLRSKHAEDRTGALAVLLHATAPVVRGLEKTIELYPDNLLFETDFPHPTSMSPGPASTASAPHVYADRALGGLAEDLIGKVLHHNAARVYHLD